jgi:transposase
MQDRELYRVLLGLNEPWFVSDVDLNAAKQLVTVHVKLPRGSHLVCEYCGQGDCPVHDYQERTWRHLDTCQFKTLIQAPLPRVKCSKCGVKTASPPWATGHSRFTLLFERFAIDVLGQMSISGACKVLRISWHEADGIIGRAVQRGLGRRKIEKLTGIGIDEKAFRGNDFVTVVHDLSNSNVLWVGKSRKAEALDDFFKQLGPQLCASIECISADMWKGYALACRNWIPDADKKVVIDRFHIERYLGKAIDEVRQQEHNYLSRKKDQRLKATKWQWLVPFEKLPDNQRVQFEQLRTSDLRTAKAYAIRETFRHFWQLRDLSEARDHFNNWYNWVMRTSMLPMRRVAKMLKRNLEHLLNYIKYRVSNSRAEGINNKIQTVKKKAYGFRNVDRFIDMIYFHCSKLELYPNPL